MCQPVKKDCIASLDLLRGFEHEHIINLSRTIEATSRAIVQYIHIFQNWFVVASTMRQFFLTKGHDCDQIMEKILNQSLTDIDHENLSITSLLGKNYVNEYFMFEFVFNLFDFRSKSQRLQEINHFT